ncbi:hypothetical protein F4779DRAFT_419629 [Xylariaceae sp. FL0662B]|nr:hypothetical protein F4779DRAFT_419629 [Xylariaceae sp. FL0662B]
MASACESSRSSLRRGQPWLEVTPSTDPEVVSFESPESTGSRRTLPGVFKEQFPPQAVPYEYTRWYGPEVVSQPGEADKVFVNAAGLPPKKETPGLEPISTLQQGKLRWRKHVIIAMGVLVIIGAVVGGVAGSIVSRNRNSESESGSPTATAAGDATSTSGPTATATLKFLKPNSRLAVTGWRANGIFKIRLFYQDRKDNLRFSDYSSDDSTWSSSNKVSTGGVIPGTPLGAAAIVQNDPPQHELFWLNSSSMLSGQNFRDGTTGFGGVQDSIDSYPVTTHGKSRLAMYWPYAVTQDEDNSLRLVTYMNGLPNPPWTNRSLGFSGSEGAAMAIIPRSSTYTSPHTAGLVYRSSDGKLSGYTLQWNLTGLDWSIDGSMIPFESAIGAFAVAKKDDPNDGTNTYIIYQNNDNDINLVANKDNAWETSIAILKGADAGTDITCLTEAVWENIKALSSRYDMSRCYFLSGGRIREVLYNGTDWEELGNIPLS